MTAGQYAIGYVSTALTAVLLATLLKRRHAASAPLLTLYVAWITLSQTLIALSPEQFHTQNFWLVHKVAEAALRFGIALELAHRIFRGFPGAAASAMNAILAIAAIAAFATASIYSPRATYTEIVTVVVPRVAQATAWMLTALSLLVLWYRIPLTSLHRAVLLGMTPYLLVFSAGMALLQSAGWELRNQVGYVTALCFVCMVGYWTVVAWKTQPVEALPGFAARSPSVDRTAA